MTHTASQRYNPRICEDDSGNITGIKDITKYVFINYLKKFFFADEVSAQNYDRAYRSFISSNTRDEEQNYSSTFNIDGFEEEVGFCAMGEGSHNSCIYYLTALFGVAIIYSCILERSVSRY